MHPQIYSILKEAREGNNTSDRLDVVAIIRVSLLASTAVSEVELFDLV